MNWFLFLNESYVQVWLKWIGKHCCHHVLWDFVLFCNIFIFSWSPLSVLIFHCNVPYLIFNFFLHKLWKIFLHFNPELKRWGFEEATVFFPLLSQLKIKLLLGKLSLCEKLFVTRFICCFQQQRRMGNKDHRVKFKSFLKRSAMKDRVTKHWGRHWWWFTGFLL